MKNILYTSIIIGLFLLVSACEKEVQLELKEADSKLAVSCNFSPDEPFVLELSKSRAINSTNLGTSIINNADVQICVEDEVVETILPINSSPDANPKYKSTVALPKIKKIYTLKIEADGLAPITATSSIPEAVEISHSTIGAINSFLTDDSETVGYMVRLGVQLEDPIDETNYYQISFRQEILSSESAVQQNVIKILPNENYNLIDNNIVNNINLIDGGILFNDLTFDGMTKEFVFEPEFFYKPIEFNTNITNKPINIIIELRSVSEEYYKYYSSIYRQASRDTNTPFSNPTVIYSNVDNGYGIFAGYSKSVVKTPVEL